MTGEPPDLLSSGKTVRTPNSIPASVSPGISIRVARRRQKRACSVCLNVTVQGRGLALMLENSPAATERHVLPSELNSSS